MRRNQNGFTLVELAIVMIIIGLLIGGILKGQEIVANAKVNATIKAIKEIKAAAVTFEDKYAFMPGDVRAGVVKNCNAANNCRGGNQNGTVTAAPGDSAVAWSTFINPANNSASRDWMEAYQFWKHLALNDMIVGVNSAANPLNADERAWGSTNPVAPVGGGFEFFYDHWTTIRVDGHILRISETGMQGTAGANGGSVSPAQAAQIDRKLDNGLAFSGEVYADYGRTNTPCKNGDVYNENDPGALCVLFIRLFQ
jgi:prepilin-type N-terminal cleavage/methylation domain-containing protein